MSVVSKVVSSIGREYSSVHHAYRVGARCNQMHNELKVLGGLNAVYKKVGTAPTVGIVIGTVSPIPGGTIMGYTAGKAFQKLVKFIKFHCLKR